MNDFNKLYDFGVENFSFLSYIKCRESASTTFNQVFGLNVYDQKKRLVICDFFDYLFFKYGFTIYRFSKVSEMSSADISSYRGARKAITLSFVAMICQCFKLDDNDQLLLDNIYHDYVNAGRPVLGVDNENKTSI